MRLRLLPRMSRSRSALARTLRSKRLTSPLVRSDLAGVCDAIELSRATLRKIRQNLFFAFVYNVLGIPLAALGFLNPVIAGGDGDELCVGRWQFIVIAPLAQAARLRKGV